MVKQIRTPGGQVVDIEIESARCCYGCAYWRRHQCALLACELPAWVAPLRPQACFDAERAAVEELAAGKTSQKAI
mgnify:CR=1 FL=1